MKNAVYAIKIMVKEAPIFCLLHILNTVFDSAKIYILAVINKLLINNLIFYASNKQIKEGIYTLFFILLFVFLAELFHSIISHFFKYHMYKSTLCYHDKMEQNFLFKLESLDISLFDSPQKKNELLQAKKDMKSIETIFLNVTTIIISLASTIVSIIIILKLDYLLFIGVLISLIPSFVARKKIQKKAYQQEKDLNLTTRKVSYFSGLFWSRNVAQEMRLFNYSNKIMCLLKNLFDYRNQKNLQLTLKTTIIEILSLIISGILSLTYNMYIIFIVLSKGLTVGDYSYYSTISGNFKGNIDIISKNFSSYLINIERVHNYRTFIEQEPSVTNDGHTPISSDTYRIEFENVTFVYPESNEKVINNLSFSIEPGEIIAFAGLNGAGKSTIIKLLLRFYDPTEGRILLNGVDIKNYDLLEYRRIFSAVFQTPVNYSLSVEENITISDCEKEVSSTTINELLDYVGLNRLISNHNVQINKDFDTDGIVLSVGQSQELSIARALYRDSPILVFDEPAASLDASIQTITFIYVPPSILTQIYLIHIVLEL